MMKKRMMEVLAMAILTISVAAAYSHLNQNLSKSATELYDFICDIYGNAIISGQQESTWMGSDQYEFEYIYERTGRYPAIRGARLYER